MTGTTVFTWMESPIGPLLLAGQGESLSRLVFPGGKRRINPHPDWRRDEDAFAEVRRQLALYFAGRLTRFDVVIAPSGTAFQLRVWQALATIPYGQTMSYGALARQIGHPEASRAVGAANGANPLPIIVPCHRVIGASGALTGFGGGLETKRFLLDLEQPRLL